MSKTPKSLSIPVRMPGPIIDISTMPPCNDDATAASPPSVPPGKSFTVELAAALLVHELGEALGPQIVRGILGVRVGELDGALLDLLR